MIKFRVLTIFLADNLQKGPKIGKNKYFVCTALEALIFKYQTLDKKKCLLTSQAQVRANF